MTTHNRHHDVNSAGEFGVCCSIELLYTCLLWICLIVFRVRLLVLTLFQCSYFHCGSQSYKAHKRAAKKFMNNYDVDDKVTCYVDTKNHKHVALVATSSAGALASLLVISLTLMLTGGVVCLIMFVVATLKQREIHRQQDKKRLMGRDDDSDGRSTASSASAGGARNKTSADLARPATKTGVRVKMQEV